MLGKPGNRSGYYLLYLFMIGLFLGILFVNFRHDVWIRDDGLLSAAVLEQMRSSEPDSAYLFGYIVRHRILTVFFLIILFSTIIGFPIVCGYVCYLGASVGCFLSVAVIRYGIRGLFFVIASIFPQVFLLVPGYLLLFMWGIERVGGNGFEHGLYGRQPLLKRGIKLAGIIVIVLAGCLLESYVNPSVLQFFLKIF